MIYARDEETSIALIIQNVIRRHHKDIDWEAFEEAAQAVLNFIKDERNQ